MKSTKQKSICINRCIVPGRHRVEDQQSLTRDLFNSCRRILVIVRRGFDALQENNGGYTQYHSPYATRFLRSKHYPFRLSGSALCYCLFQLLHAGSRLMFPLLSLDRSISQIPHCSVGARGDEAPECLSSCVSRQSHADRQSVYHLV